MSPKRVYVMYCAEILQSNERIKKKKLPTTVWNQKTEGDRSNSEDGFLRSLSPTGSASYQISLFVLWMLSNLN